MPANFISPPIKVAGRVEVTKVKEDVRLTHFRITCADGTAVTNELYANGRHQCKLIVEVLKEGRSKSGVWSRVALTAQERASVKIVASNFDQVLPVGWACDNRKNSYDLGLRKLDALLEVVPEQQTPAAIDSNIEHVKRFMRFERVDTIEPVNFVAEISLGGQAYTTNISTSDRIFDSSVCIQPMLAPRLEVADLQWGLDGEAYEAGGAHVKVYYWTPPAGFSFFENKGLDKPLELVHEGDSSQTSYVVKLSNGLWGRSCTLINKDSINAPVYMNDIYKGFNLPEPNPKVRFNKYRTIMRALDVRGGMPSLVNKDSGSVWRLLDNFGSEHGFKITSGAGYELTLVDLPRAVRVRDFKIKLVGDEVYTNELYANGLQQCKVFIYLRLEEEYEKDKWRQIALTNAQRASVTVASYSANPNEALAAGWRCDTQKNIYDSGLWRSGVDEQEVVEVPVQTVAGSGPFTEVIERYMRFDRNIAPTQVQRFMARVVVGGQVYTTNSNGVDNSSVSIFPTIPYLLRVQDLEAIHDGSAQHDSSTDVDVAYYRIRGGLRIVSHTGLEKPMNVILEGDHFQTSFLQAINKDGYKYCKAGIVVRKDAPGAELRVNDIHKGVNGSNPPVRYNLGSTMFCTVKMWFKVYLGVAGDNKCRWHLRDNYGCEHVFFIVKEESGLKSGLRQG